MPLHTEIIGAGAPRLVCCHGFTQTGRSWVGPARALGRRHQVVLVDLPGHGDSDHAAADLWESARLVGEAGGRAVYVAYSMGGRVALHLALLRPELVAGLVVVGANAGIDDAAERAQRRSADDALAAGLERDGLEPFLDRWLAQPLFASLPPSAAGRDDRRRNRPDRLASSLRRTGPGTQEPLWQRVGVLTMPVLVIAGDRDEKFSALGRRLAAAVGENATFALVAGAGHAAHLEQPAAFANLLDAWLGGLPELNTGQEPSRP